MTTQKLTVGIVAPSAEVRESLTAHVEATQLASVKLVVDEYCAVEDDYPTQRFIEAHPDIAFVDMQDQRAGIKTLFTLHGVLPDVSLYACGAQNDPQLIIETMQAGAREFLAKPVNARGIGMAFGRYIDEKERVRSATLTRGKIYTVTSAKGGAGATSVAVNLATTLAGVSKSRIAVLDLNSPVGDAASYLNLKPQFSLSDALTSTARLDSVLLDTFMTKMGNLALLPGPKQYKSSSIAPPGLAKLLRVVAGTYGHVFIDMPSTLEMELLQIIADASESVLVVMTPELPAIWRTHRLLSLLSGSGCADRLRLVLNRDSSKDEITEKEIVRALNFPVFARLPNNYSAAIESINKGKPIVEVNHSTLASAYRQLAQSLTGVNCGRSQRGFSKFFLG